MSGGVNMKKKNPVNPTKLKLPQKKQPPKVKEITPPQEVHIAIRKLLDTTNHIQARAAELEGALDILREQERGKAVRDLFLALRNSPDGDLLRFHPVAAATGESSQARAIVAALAEAFGIESIREIGERIAVRHGEVPDSLELDRSIGEETGKCIGAEVVSVGWKLGEHTLLKPVVRPLFK
jgi:hypothetical protein